MQFDNDRLLALKQQIGRKNQLHADLIALNKQRDSLRNKLFQLKKWLLKEQNDVDALEESGLKTFFYSVIGKFNEKFDKETAEAAAAKNRYDTVSQELAAITEQIKGIEAELYELKDCESDFKQLLDEKVAIIKESNNPYSEKVYDFERKITILQSELTIMKDTISSGEATKESVKLITTLEEEAAEHRNRAYSRYTTGFAEKIERREVERCSILADAERENLPEIVCTFKNYLVMMMEFAGKYDDINIFPRFIDWYFENDVLTKSIDPNIYVRDIHSVLNMLNRIFESIEKAYAELNAEFEDMIMHTTL